MVLLEFLVVFKISNIPRKFVKYIDVALFKAVTKGFLQVCKDTTGKVAIVKSISYHFCEAYKSMIS